MEWKWEKDGDEYTSVSLNAATLDTESGDETTETHTLTREMVLSDLSGFQARIDGNPKVLGQGPGTDPFSSRRCAAFERKYT